MAGSKIKKKLFKISETIKKIHTGTNFENFGDGFFSVWNPFGETSKLKITTSNLESDHRNTVQVNATVGLFQCFQVGGIYLRKT
jgi:hypothetical protein